MTENSDGKLRGRGREMMGMMGNVRSSVLEGPIRLWSITHIFVASDDLKQEVIYDLDEVHQVGTFVKISQLSGSPNKLQLTLEGHRRIEIISAAATEQEEGPVEKFLSRADEEDEEVEVYLYGISL